MPARDPGDRPFTWQNPVLRGCCPDPSVVRVGADYILATSTFEYLPGIRLFHSVNLVDWTPLGGAVTRPAQYRRDGQPGPIALFAPTLRHHEGRFYLACTNVTPGQGNFILTADEPAGAWSDAIWLDEEAFDPSLFFDDDGTCYYTRRTLDLSDPARGLGPIVQAAIDPDSGESGPMRPITSGSVGFCSNDIEGPHLFKRGDWYYLTAAEGGTWAGHMQTIARSRSPGGPFEPAPHNPILTHRHRVMHPIQSLGHCDFVEDPAGDWWALSLGTRHKGRHHLLGRETFLHAVTWSDGWPLIGADGTTEVGCQASANPTTAARSRATPPTPAAEGWQWIGPKDPKATRAGEGLSFTAGRSVRGAATGTDAIGALFQPLSEFDQAVQVDLPVPEAGQVVGAGFFADPDHFSVLRLERAGHGLKLWLERRADDLVAPGPHWSLPLGPVRVVLTAQDGRHGFTVVSADGQQHDIGPFRSRLMSAESTEWFTSLRFVLLAESAHAETVDFTVTEVAPADPEGGTQ